MNKEIDDMKEKILKDVVHSICNYDFNEDFDFDFDYITYLIKNAKNDDDVKNIISSISIRVKTDIVRDIEMTFNDVFIDENFF